MSLAPIPRGWGGVRVAVWGAARTGLAAANLLARKGARVLLSDSRALDPHPEGLDDRVEVVGGGNVLGGAAFLVPSPGIPPSTPALRQARAAGVRLIGEIELAAQFARAPIVAITGTDGKSTTTAMIGAAIEGAGRPVVVAGNIGDPLCDHVESVGPEGVVVAEVSAFQLWSCGVFRPRVAVLTNIAEDHVEYFQGDVSAYRSAKARVLADQGAGDAAVLRLDDPIVAGFQTRPGVARVGFSPAPREAGWGLAEGWLTCDGRPVLAAGRLPLPGLHNVSNALAALAAGTALGLDAAELLPGLLGFRGLPHRLELVAERAGVRFYDDSKATNPHAARVGLQALEPPLIVIAGGYEKGLDQALFVDVLVERARQVVLLGGTAERTERELAGRVPVRRVGSMQAAVQAAAQLARAGESVVLSPASSSFDLFDSYGHRGQVFQAAVRGLVP